MEFLLTIFMPKIRSVCLFMYCILKASSVIMTVSFTRCRAAYRACCVAITFCGRINEC